MTLWNWMFNGKKNRAQGPERIRLTNSLMAALWMRRDADGNQRIGWSIDRVNEDNLERPFRTLTVRSLFEVPDFVQHLARTFIERGIAAEHKKQLADLALVMSQVSELMRDSSQVNGAADGSSNSTPSRVLSR